MRLKEEYREAETIKKSTFIACVAPAFTEEEARFYIDYIRSEYPDATHVCTAYILGENDQIQRSSDNHEPSGTAGVPMLESIRNSNLKNTVACVVRYFGGIKLGAGGLIRAYSGSVTNALQHAPKLEQVPMNIYEVKYPYDLVGSVEHWIRTNAEILDLQYSEFVTCQFITPLQDIGPTIQDLSRGISEAKLIKETFKEVEVEE